MKVEDHHVMEDVCSILALTPCYVSAEPFIEGSYDLRIQKIGTHLRAFRRISVSGSWKTNTGSAHVEEITLTAEHTLWINEASKMFGGLDICTVDAIHDTTTDRDVIMEVNGTASGFLPTCQEEDNRFIAELVIERMNALHATHDLM